MIKKCTNPAGWHPTLHMTQKHHHPPVAWRKLMRGTYDWWQIIELCGLCHDEYHTLLDLHVRFGAVPPGRELRTYSLFIRRLVAQAWADRPPGRPPYTLTAPVLSESRWAKLKSRTEA
jgi:hypothetical protein